MEHRKPRRRRCPKNSPGKRPAYLTEAKVRRGKILRCNLLRCDHWASRLSDLCWCHHWAKYDEMLEDIKRYNKIPYG